MTNPSTSRPVACPRLTVPAELHQLRDWLDTVQRFDEKHYPRSGPTDPIPGLSRELIGRYIATASRINQALEANE